MNLESTLLVTDLYQLTMLHGYYSQGMADTATFELFVRDLPPERNFLVAAGLEQVLELLEDAHFSDDELSWLAGTGHFPAELIDHLSRFRFTGDVHAMPEGTLFFPDEPVLRVTAPVSEAQLVESRIINLIHFQTLIASKAARCKLAAPDAALVDFGLRRAHGAEAGLLAARGSYLAGFAGSATVLAGRRFGIPLFGTMAHSYIESHEDEISAFKSFARAQPDNATLLIDTYDTVDAARKVVDLAGQLAHEGISIKGVRLDSGNLAAHAHRVRAILDDGGLHAVNIFTSGNLDEYQIASLLADGAPIDGFGVGTRLDTAADAPYLDCAYKLTEYAGKGRRKKSEQKATWPGRKQVYRRFGSGGRMIGDTITLEESPGEGEPLLEPVMKQGRRLTAVPLETARQRLARQLDTLPEPMRGIKSAPAYPVEKSEPLRALAAEVDADLEQHLKRHRRGTRAGKAAD